jgi:tRNA(fMet)-specific endonuclease VapC
MRFLLDTNICSAHMRRPAKLAHRFIQHIDQLAVPTVVLGELYAGAYKHEQSNRLLSLIDELLEEVYVIDFDVACAHQFGQLRGSSLRSGTLFSTVDLMIASVAIIHDLTLITHNTKDFENIPGLRYDDWLRD